jgi:proton glutamate symport protein
LPRPRIVLLALVLGLVLGAVIAGSPEARFAGVVAWIEPLGLLWINALRMVVIPLVVSMLVGGVASLTDLGVVRRLGGTALAVWVGLLLLGGVLGLTLVPFLFSGLSLDPAATAALRESVAATAGSTAQGLERMPGFAQWAVDLVPANPIRAAADGAMLPLVVFALAFGLAATRVEEDQRQALLRFFGGVSEAMLVLVRWVLALTPVGVFALTLGVASRLGVAAAGALGYYLAVTAVSMLVLLGALFAAAVVVGRTSPLRLARALLPAQVVGFTSRSSLASLPAQAEAAVDRLHLPPAVTGFVLPLAVASFKPHAPVNWSSLAIVSALLYGVPIGPLELATVVGSAILLSFAVPGIPSAGMLLIAPVFADVGIPVEAIGLLIAVDAIPDMFKTVANVTGQFASTVVVARLHR